MDRDKSLRRRVLSWLVPAIVIAAVAAAVGAVLGIRHELQSTDAFHVGTCFQAIDETNVVETSGLRELSGRAKVVSCGTQHDAEITRAVRQPSDCQAEGAWLNSREQTYCVRLAD